MVFYLYHDSLPSIVYCSFSVHTIARSSCSLVVQFCLTYLPFGQIMPLACLCALIPHFSWFFICIWISSLGSGTFSCTSLVFLCMISAHAVPSFPRYRFRILPSQRSFDVQSLLSHITVVILHTQETSWMLSCLVALTFWRLHLCSRFHFLRLGNRTFLYYIQVIFIAFILLCTPVLVACCLVILC